MSGVAFLSFFITGFMYILWFSGFWGGFFPLYFWVYPCICLCVYMFFFCFLSESSVCFILFWVLCFYFISFHFITVFGCQLYSMKKSADLCGWWSGYELKGVQRGETIIRILLYEKKKPTFNCKRVATTESGFVNDYFQSSSNCVTPQHYVQIKQLLWVRPIIHNHILLIIMFQIEKMDISFNF